MERKPIARRVTKAPPYIQLFDKKSHCWSEDETTNRFFLHAQQDYANDLLKTRGHLFLNEVLDMLGIPRTKAGQVIGWVYLEENHYGDNCVDFGLLGTGHSGVDGATVLNFNVDGNILGLI